MAKEKICPEEKTKPKGKRKKPLSIAEVQRLAKAEGLTYGQYVVKYGGVKNWV